MEQDQKLLTRRNEETKNTKKEKILQDGICIMDCRMCNKNTIKLKSKIPMCFGLKMKCSHCDARYKRGFMYKKTNLLMDVFSYILSFLLEIFWLPLFILIFWLYYSVSLLISIPVTILILLSCVYFPIRLDDSDPVNKIVSRIQNKP